MIARATTRGGRTSLSSKPTSPAAAADLETHVLVDDRDALATDDVDEWIPGLGIAAGAAGIGGAALAAKRLAERTATDANDPGSDAT